MCKKGDRNMQYPERWYETILKVVANYNINLFC